MKRNDFREKKLTTKGNAPPPPSLSPAPPAAPPPPRTSPRRGEGEPRAMPAASTKTAKCRNLIISTARFLGHCFGRVEGLDWWWWVQCSAVAAKKVHPVPGRQGGRKEGRALPHLNPVLYPFPSSLPPVRGGGRLRAPLPAAPCYRRSASQICAVGKGFRELLRYPHARAYTLRY